MTNCDSMEFLDIEYECEPEDNKQLRKRIREHIHCCNSSSLNHWPLLAIQSEKFLSSIRMAYVYGAKANSALVVTEDNKVYAIGDNLVECIPVEGNDPFLPRLVIDLYDINIKTLAWYKKQNVLALASNGALYYGHKEFIRVNGGTCILKGTSQPHHNITMVACTTVKGGGFYTVSKDGTMHHWTTDTKSGSSLPTPSVITSFYDKDEIVQIAAIDVACIILFNTGKVYFYQGGTHSPLIYPEYIEKIACGYEEILALSDMGHIYQFNVAKTITSIAIKLVELEHALDIAAINHGHFYTATLLNGKIFMWGTCGGINVTQPICSPYTSVEETFARFATWGITPMPLIISKPRGVELSLINCLAQQFDNPDTSDFIIKVGEKCIYVHKLILAMRSDYFRGMFNNDWKETKNGIMDHEEFSYDVYRTYLKYLYTDTIDISTQIAMDMVPVAEFYNDDQLKGICIKILSNGLTISDAMIIYDCALRYMIKELQDACVNFALHNMTNVVQSPAFSQLHPKVRMNLFITFAKSGCFKT